jgi:hypothetical protein
MQKRLWIRSGIVEELDIKQLRLIDLVYQNVKRYYLDLYRTRPMYQYPLSLSRLAKLCNRSGSSVLAAVRILANTVPIGEDEPLLFYDRVAAQGNRSHRPYRIWLRQKGKRA